MEELSSENLMELEKELNNSDESSDVNPVKHLSTKQLTELFKHFGTVIAITYENDGDGEKYQELPEQLRMLWHVTQNSIARGRKLHFSSLSLSLSLSVTSSGELKLVNSPGSAREPVQPDHVPHLPVYSELSD
jgi:hypothetical protein